MTSYLPKLPNSISPLGSFRNRYIIYLNLLDKDALIAEVSVGVTFAALMSATALFFTGMLITQYQSFGPTIKVPLVFLIISTFSFIFSATIYSNVGSEITLGKLKLVEKYMVYAKNIVELLGLYMFVLATPMVIGAVTNDSFLRTSTIVIALSGFGLYSQSKFSVLEKELTNSRKKLLSGMIIVLTVALYTTQRLESSSSPLFIYNSIGVALVLTLVIATYYFCTHSKQYKPMFFRSFEDNDADALSKMILGNLSRIKKKDYPKASIDAMRETISPAALRRLAGEKDVYVVEFNSRLVGLGALKNNVISSVFADTSLRRKGIGRLLVDHLEAVAHSSGHTFTETMSSTIDHAFYERLGYRNFREMGTKGTDRMIVMRKTLPPQ